MVACDFYAATEILLCEGELKQAIAASIAIPALFRPVLVNGRYLIDGGACNPLPFDHIADCPITVASDVTGGPHVLERSPRLIECVVGAAQISMQSVIREKLKRHQPDVLVRPEINGVFVMDFLKTQAILEMNVAFKDDLKRRLDAIITAPSVEPLPSPADLKKAAQQPGRRRFADSGINLWRMVAGHRAKEAHPVLDAAALGVAGAIIEPANAGKGNGSRA
jgi:NTE family protein